MNLANQILNEAVYISLSLEKAWIQLFSLLWINIREDQAL